MRIVFNFMNYNNPHSGGLSVLIDQMKFLKEANFSVGIYYYSFIESNQIQQIAGNEFSTLALEDLDPKNDLVVIAEEFIWVARDILIPRGIPYIIFNQGIFASLWSYNSLTEHIEVYKNAQAVLSNSLHTTKGLKEIFEVPKEKIYLHRIGIDTNLYHVEPKEKIACYLKYKNSGFSRYIDRYFRDKYPDWELIGIEKTPRAETAAIFRKSKLFLSFGGPEGFGLPPLEAAFCGCKVIGFHGEAGKEYFKEPTFTSVNFMDHIDFIEKLKITMSDLDNNIDKGHFDYADYLRYFYSITNSKKSTIDFFTHVTTNLVNTL